jgi:hypothetical protein
LENALSHRDNGQDSFAAKACFRNSRKVEKNSRFVRNAFSPLGVAGKHGHYKLSQNPEFGIVNAK